MSGFITFIRMFLGIASDEAMKAYERKKAREKAAAKAKKDRAKAAEAVRVAKEEAERARKDREEVDRRIEAADRKATLAQNDLDLLHMLRPIDPEGYPTAEAAEEERDDG